MPPIPPWAQEYMGHIRKHGPLPPNYQPFQKNGKAFYGEDELKNEFNFFPTSPEGGAKNVPIVEDKETRVSCIGSILPQFTYTAAEWSCVPKRDHVAALSAALLSSGARKNNQEAIMERITSELASLPKGNRPAVKIWHPADRNTPIFQDEANVAEIARAFGRSLVIVSPQIAFGGEFEKEWNRVWFAEPERRRPTRARWSVGVQANFPEIILGCLPEYGNSGQHSVHWFTLIPLGRRKNRMDGIPIRLTTNAPQTFSKILQFPETVPGEFLVWVLVAAHRTFLWSLNEIRRGQIGSYIQQYGHHIAANAPAAWKASEPKLLSFDPNKKYTGQRVDFWDVHNFVCAAGPDSLVGKCAELWDTAIQAKMQYDEKLNPTDKDWDFLVDKLARVSYANFWSQVVKKK